MTAPNLPPFTDWPRTWDHLREIQSAAYQSGYQAALDQVKSRIEAMGQNKEVE